MLNDLVKAIDSIYEKYPKLPPFKSINIANSGKEAKNAGERWVEIKFFSL